jgi:thiol-disulfide isomerase/thioredoxin
MKNLLKHTALFIVLAFAFSALTSCTGTNTATVNGGGNIDSNATKKEKPNYPPVASAIMTADLKYVDGTSFKLQDKKGKVVLVNLWATWCQPCIAEMPHLVEMQEKYKDKGFEIVGLDTDDEETKEQIETFAAKHKLNYQLGWASEQLKNEFMKITQLDAIPQSILINRDGQLNGVFKGGGMGTVTKMRETVDKLMTE